MFPFFMGCIIYFTYYYSYFSFRRINPLNVSLHLMHPIRIKSVQKTMYNYDNLSHVCSFVQVLKSILIFKIVYIVCISKFQSLYPKLYMGKLSIVLTLKQELVFLFGRFIGIRSHSLALIFKSLFDGRYNLKV